ncbi:NAD(P)/FAD-dependent oxidoreductase [Rhodocytophaga aerolata]|uniref:NAD(P)/FAD-dependent oxidoreductase n=1 Tax=Rhodocytophaga aerolata TaxID=455078 RepID=A0ABT8R7J4_9BACT|nr:NAD(P)/FAD-dependent oxidoreductase [Rhodocytophaga aerolata]MDO1446650.1 NAD(P)/FAD-dependent oxidoreductase [Rhodocytophaga aerolata]
MKRRNFLKTTGLLTTASMLYQQAPTQAQPRLGKGEHVLILGAGLAGLAAAYALFKQQVPFTILEARNRIGGRVFTHQVDEESKLHVELGAEWIGASHERMLALCKEFNLPLLNHQFTTHLTLEGQHYKPKEWQYDTNWNTTYQTLLTNFKQISSRNSKVLDQIDWWKYLINNGISERDIEIKELFDSTDFGESIRNVSAFASLSEYAYSSPNNEMDFRIEGGNTRLVNALSEKIGLEHILLNKKATAINQTGKQVQVLCEDGTKHTGSRLLCTIPAFALTKINWQPALPAEKLDALHQMQYCRIIKSAVVFKERFWQDETFDMITDSTAHYFFHSSKNQPNTKGTLTSYAIGDKAYILSKMNQEQKIREICAALKPAFGDVSQYAEKATSYYWGGDAFTKGAYAIYDTHQWFSIREMMAKPFRNISFAGEHLAEWQGFMEGAVQTGEEAVKKMLT